MSVSLYEKESSINSFTFFKALEGEIGAGFKKQMVGIKEIVLLWLRFVLLLVAHSCKRKLSSPKGWTFGAGAKECFTGRAFSEFGGRDCAERFMSAVEEATISI